MSSKRRQRRRSCERKKRYRTEKRALADMNYLVANGNAHGWMNVYHCQFCGGWHVGTMPKYVRQAIQEKA